MSADITKSNASPVTMRYGPISTICFWPPCVADADIIFSSCGFFFLLFYFLTYNLSGRRLEVYHTSTHGVALVQIYKAGLKRAACGSLKIQDAKKSPKIAIWAPSHKFVGLYLRK